MDTRWDGIMEWLMDPSHGMDPNAKQLVLDLMNECWTLGVKDGKNGTISGYTTTPLVNEAYQKVLKRFDEYFWKMTKAESEAYENGLNGSLLLKRWEALNENYCAVLKGQEDLKKQTVRIRAAALGPYGKREGKDTEDIVRELRKERDHAEHEAARWKALYLKATKPSWWRLKVVCGLLGHHEYGEVFTEDGLRVLGDAASVWSQCKHCHRLNLFRG